MKLQTNTSVVEVSGGQAQGSFGIKQSPKAFQILSSGLYTNKPMAIVRELSANASDAHVLNGNQKKPFEIKLPNKLDNQFYIKDFGPGLTHDQVMTLYTTYFDSTKSDSNDFIGGLGLGSKSPFSYTDAFTVESRQKGVKRTYSAFVAENGVPQIVQLGDSIPTDEEDGLTVGFPVQPSDYEAFRKEAQRILPWFEPMPNVLGTTINKLDKPVQSYQDLSLHTKIPVWTDSSWEKKTFIRMGNIIYPLDWSASGLSEYSDISTLLNNPSRSSSFVFTVPIGSVEVAASREGLQYDRGSKANLKEFAESLVKKLGGILETEIKSITSKYPRFEANARLASLESHWGFTFKQASKIFEDKGLSYPQLKAASEIVFPSNEFQHLDVQLLTGNSRVAADVIKGRVYSGANSAPMTFQPSQAYLVLECDTRGGIAAGKALIKQKPAEIYYEQHRSYGAAVLIKPKSLKSLNSPEYIKERDELLKSLGQPPLGKTSAYTPPSRASFGSRANVKVSKEELEVYSLDNAYYNRTHLTRNIVEADKIQAWTSLDATSLQCSASSSSYSCSAADLVGAYNIVRSIAKEAGLNVPDKLYGVPSKYKARLEKLTAGTNVWEWMVKTLKNPEVLKKLAASSDKLEYAPSREYNWTDRNNAQTFVQGISKNQDIFESLGPNWQRILNSTTESSEVEKIHNLLGAFFLQNNVDLKALKPTVLNATKMYQEFFKAAPLLTLAIRELGDDKNKELLQDLKKYMSATVVPEPKIYEMKM